MNHETVEENGMTVYTYPSYHDESESKSPGYEPRPMRVWFDPATQVYHGEKDFGDFKVPVTHELGEKTLDKLKLAVDWHGPLPDSISESLANDSADLRSCQNNPKFPQVLSAGMKGIRGRDTNEFQYLYLYETANAEQNIEVNFNFATGMFDIQKSDQWNGHSDLYIQGITPEFGTSSVQEVHDILNTLGTVPSEVTTWVNDMSSQYPRFEKRENPEAERYRMISIMIDDHQKWLDKQEDGKQASFVGVDVSGNHFRGRDLSQVNFTGCDMRGITNIDQANFFEAIMPNTNWQGMEISEVGFEVVNLNGANFRETKLKDVTFSGDLNNTDFTLSEMSEIHFAGPIMFGAVMSEAKISACFSQMKLDTLCLDGAHLTACEIIGCDISNWHLKGTKIQAVIDFSSFATLNEDNQSADIDLTFGSGNISARGATIITIPITNVPVTIDGGIAYIAFLPDQNAFVGAIDFDDSYGSLFIESRYRDEGAHEKIKFMKSVKEIQKGMSVEVQDDIEIPVHLQVKMQRLLDENTKRLTSNNTSKEPEHAEENSQGR